jgi:hypothetical protein
MSRITMFVVAALVAGGLVVAGTSHSGAAHPTTYAPQKCSKPRVKPSLIVITCADAGLYLKIKHWSYWNGREAGGTAKAFANDCDPYCAAGKYHKGHAKIRLTKPRKRTCNGRKGIRIFQRIKFHWKDKPLPGLGRKYDLFCWP